MKDVLLSFKFSTEAEQSAFANNVYQRMSSDPQFATYKPQIDALKVKIDAYNVAVANAVNGGKDRTLVKNECREALINHLVIIAFYVDILANGNEAVILASGYALRKKSRTPKLLIHELPAPDGLRVANLDKNGVVVLSFNPVEHARMYAIEHFVSGEEAWKNGKYSTTPSETVLSGYTPGNNVKFRIRALGETGIESNWSSAVDVWVS